MFFNEKSAVANVESPRFQTFALNEMNVHALTPLNSSSKKASVFLQRVKTNLRVVLVNYQTFEFWILMCVESFLNPSHALISPLQ